MLDVPAGLVGIGLDERRVAEVADRWREVGVIDDWIRKECPRHPVRIDAFRIARYPVTNAEYRVFLDDTGAEALPTSWEFGRYPAHRANHPVGPCAPSTPTPTPAGSPPAPAAASGCPPRPSGSTPPAAAARPRLPVGRRLPARPRQHRRVPDRWPPPRSASTRQGARCSASDAWPGNVEEFVADDFLPYPGGAPVADDLLRAAGSYRVARGGSFTRFGDLARCPRRHGWFNRRIYAIGFRLAETSYAGESSRR